MTRIDTMLWLFDDLNCGALLLDERGAIVDCNATAQRFLHKHAPHQPHERPAADSGLDRTLRRLFTKGLPDSHACIAIAHSSRADSRPLIAYRMPRNVPVGQTTGAIIVLVDMEERPPSSIGALRHIFGLTLAEARLAARLAAGESLRRIAADQCVSIETARAQLKCVLAKTRTHRQAELVALVNRLALLP